VALRLASPGVHLAVWDVKRDGVEETASSVMKRAGGARLDRRCRPTRCNRGRGRCLERAWGKPVRPRQQRRNFPRARALDMKLASGRGPAGQLDGNVPHCARVAARMKDFGDAAPCQYGLRSGARWAATSALRRQQGRLIHSRSRWRSTGRLWHPRELPSFPGLTRHGAAPAASRWATTTLPPPRKDPMGRIGVRRICRGGRVPSERPTPAT